MLAPRRFGVFLAPFHPPRQSPTLALRRNLRLIEHIDELGFDEVWIGEHHSGGYELIGSPEIMIAAAGERTHRISLGTGVTSLPYHHPLIIADRMVLLDHLTRGRVMLGVGPGALPSDAYMMNIDAVDQRPMMEEALEAILALLACDGPVSREYRWFALRDAQLQLRPFSDPCFEIAVAATVSPAGPRAAGRFGLSLLSLGATTASGFNNLRGHWEIMEQRSAEFGTGVDRDRWRMVGPMHLAETENQARADVRHGLNKWCEYFERVAALPLAPSAGADDLVDAMNQSGLAVIGTPDMAVEQVQRLATESGGFGCFLLMAHEWADWPATLRSYELFARFVAPTFQDQMEQPLVSLEWAASKSSQFKRDALRSIVRSAHDHRRELRNTQCEP